MTTEDKTTFGGAILAIVVVAGLLYGGWWVKREWNSFWYYDSATVEMVCDMVKPEYIKEGKCD